MIDRLVDRKKEFQSSAKNDQIRKNELEEKLKLLDQETTQLVARHGLTQSFRFESKQVDLLRLLPTGRRNHPATGREYFTAG